MCRNRKDGMSMEIAETEIEVFSLPQSMYWVSLLMNTQKTQKVKNASWANSVYTKR